MAKFAIAISMFLIASVAHGKRIGVRDDLAVSIFHPIQLLQGWLRAELDVRLLGNNNDVSREVEAIRNLFRLFKSRLMILKDPWEKQKTAYDALEDADFKNPTNGRKVFEEWYRKTDELVKHLEVCAEIGTRVGPFLIAEKDRNNELVKRLEELDEELENCISNSGFIGFFKSIFCTIKLLIYIPLNTVTVPYMPARDYLLSEINMVKQELIESSCPPEYPINDWSLEFDSSQSFAEEGETIIELAKAAK